jgi:prevent-host-death family protein
MPKLDHIKPISYFKANAAEMLRELRETGEPYVITQNGEAAAVLMDAREYEQLQQSLAMVRRIHAGDREYEEGKLVAADSVHNEIRERRKRRTRK